MSWHPATPPDCAKRRSDVIDTVLVPRTRDLGDFTVRRALPAAERQMIGPFIFFDQMGPAVFAPGQAIDVRPHPHIGLATLTWLVEGEIMHRDSLGHTQPIRPGEVNWMTAGRGIVHSERTPHDQRGGSAGLFGIQSWLALPKAAEETEPRFLHFAADALPVIEGDGARAVLVAGQAWGARSPVEAFNEALYADIRLAAGARFSLPREADERGVYLLSGQTEIDGQRFAAGALVVLKPGADATIVAHSPSHIIALGGATMDGPRHIWWNFVSSSAERIEAAKADWRAGRFGTIEGDPEFIPLPQG